MRLIEAKDYQEASRQVANIISAQVILRPDSVLGLATGSSPIGAYQQLIEWYNKGDVDFSRVRSVNLDEYVGLAPSHEQSYAYFMHHNFFDFINIKPENVHLPDGLDPDAEGQGEKYDALIRSLGGVDLQLLGIGRDGHIGFNEPCGEFVKGTHCVELTQDTREANARFFGSVDLVPKTAYTMGILDIIQARRVVMIASGSSKAAIVRDAFWGPVTPQIPASILQLHPDFTLGADEEALAMVNQEKQAGWVHKG